MHMIPKAIICFVPIIISACNFSATRPNTVDPAPSVQNGQQLNQIQKLAKSDPKTGVAEINVEQELNDQVAIQKDHHDLWFLIQDELQFNRNINQRSVQDKIAWFARNQDYLDRVADRAQPYLYHIIAKLKERNMPLDLALLPIVESAYHPFAYSPSHASGIWQFIPATGKRYGMKQNWWYDGRRDIIAATDGALDYLESLHKRFDGNWFHALAAYNAGEGNVEKAIRRNEKAGKKTDFWSLRLPRETRSYVPSLLAVAEVLKNQTKYNISFKSIPNQPHFESIATHSQIDLATVASLSDLTMDEVYTLNPGFNRWATDPNGPHRILVPFDKAADFKQKLAELPTSERISWKQHKIVQGDTLAQIARRYQTSVSALKETNRLKGNIIRAGSSLLIPTAQESSKFYSLSADARKFKGLKRTGDGKQYIYSVKRGDNLWDISRQYGISVSQLTRWNGISSKSLLRPGQKLTVWVKQDARNDAGKLIKAVAAKSSTTSAYTVKQGDSLWLIARKFDVHVKDLLKWNNLKSGNHLQPGQSIIVQQTIAGA